MAVAPSANAGVSSFGLGLLGRLVKMLGKEAYIFSEPVNAKFVPDYYDIIRNPICLNQIRARLQREEYASMASFYEVRRRWGRALGLMLGCGAGPWAVEEPSGWAGLAGVVLEWQAVLCAGSSS